jgi:hypothetical protein
MVMILMHCFAGKFQKILCGDELDYIKESMVPIPEVEHRTQIRHIV